MKQPEPAFFLEVSLATLQNLELKALDLHAQAVKRSEAERRAADKYLEIAATARHWIDHREEFIRLAKGVADGHQAVLRFPERAESKVA